MLHIYIYIYIYDISSIRVNDLTLILLTWRKWLAPNNASRQQMGFNSGFKGLNRYRPSFRGGELKRLERDVDHLPASSAEVKNEWSCTSTLPECYRGAHRGNY